MNIKLSDQLIELNCLYKEIDEIYHNLARHYGLSDSALWILYLIRENNKVYTPKEICDLLSLSKQTIHSGLKSLKTAGYIHLELSADNRKSKRIILTPSGKAFVEASIDLIFAAEHSAFGGLTAQERHDFLILYDKYASLLKKETNQLIKTASEDL